MYNCLPGRLDQVNYAVSEKLRCHACEERMYERTNRWKVESRAVFWWTINFLTAHWLQDKKTLDWGVIYWLDKKWTEKTSFKTTKVIVALPQNCTLVIRLCVLISLSVTHTALTHLLLVIKERSAFVNATSIFLCSVHYTFNIFNIYFRTCLLSQVVVEGT